MPLVQGFPYLHGETTETPQCKFYVENNLDISFSILSGTSGVVNICRVSVCAWMFVCMCIYIFIDVCVFMNVCLFFNVCACVYL